MNYKSILSISVSLGIAQLSVAQNSNSADTLIKSSTIEITQIYRPKVKQSTKPFYTPNLPAQTEATVGGTYDIPQFRLDYGYKATPLQALAISPDTSYTEFKKYIKAGFGNRNTLYLDAGAGNIQIKNSKTSLHAGFLHQKGNIPSQQQTLGILNTQTEFSRDRYIAELKFDLLHQQYYQYGYDRYLYPGGNAAKQSLSGGSANFRIREIQENRMGFRGTANAGIAYYSGSRLNSEFGAHLQLGLEKNFNDLFVLLASAEANNTSIRMHTYDTANAYASVRAGLRGEEGNWSYMASLAPTIGQGNNSYLLQDIWLQWRKGKTRVKAGTIGSLVQNTYSQQFFINPFLSGFQSVQSHCNEVFAHISQGVGHHFHWEARISWWQYERFVNYLNGFASGRPEEMLIAYVPNMNAISAVLKMRYQIGESVSVGAGLSIYNYFNHDHLSTFADNKVWHTPNTQLHGDVIWAPIKPLVVTGYGKYMGGNFSYNALKNEIISIGPVLDIGIGGEYLAIKNLSFFLNCDNLLNNKYQRWLGYQVYGINIYGGARLKF